MNLRSLGNGAVLVSPLCLGTMMVPASADDQRAQGRVFLEAIDAGINLFDTSNNYAGGEAERFLGRFLAEHRPRGVLVATKCYFPLPDAPEVAGLAPAAVRKSAERSLRNLGVETLDLLQCHRWDESVPIADTAGVMADLVREGKIRAWGLGAARPAQVLRAVLACRDNGLPAPISHQHVYHMFNRTVENELLEISELLHVGTMAYSPLAQGVLTGKYQPHVEPVEGRAADPALRARMWEFHEEQLEKAARLAALARDMGASLPSLALAWCLRKPQVSTLVCGVKTSAQLADNLGALRLDIRPDAMEEIERILSNRPRNQYMR